ncbi:MAG: NAD(P)/FAD-dependent oxidoreductase [bacterium]|jgi:pyruvate/2-oxoglutarate dehydrogenase complex dihydrolipoamide dehydrogenase (E3) component|nr:NAD(P)/FAD-dependent oxidoreductase [bacterium]
MSEEVDAVVVGLGPGGEEVARRLLEAGLSVVGIEERLLGGECPYYGCIPSKMMIRAANLLTEGRRIPGMAGESTVRPVWAPVAGRIRHEATDTWDDTVAVERFTAGGGTFVHGHGRLAGVGRVDVDGRSFEARRAVVVNPGTSPAIPPIPGLAETPHWTNREAIEAETVPPTLILLGGGSIGVELGQVFARFGSRVTIVEAADRLLSIEEPESGRLLEQVFRSEGMVVRTGARAVAVRQDGDEVVVELDGGDSVRGAKLLVATGRRPNLGDLGLERVGLDPRARTIPVDDHLRAGERLWAIGDVDGKGAFTHISMYHAGIAVADILGREAHPADYRGLSRVTFTDPEVGAAGLTEAQARSQGIRVRVGVGQVAASTRGWIHGPGNAGFHKLVEDADRGVLVGATSVGPMGGEVLSMLTLAIHARVPTDTLRGMIYAYPTFHRGILDALADLGSE